MNEEKLWQIQIQGMKIMSLAEHSWKAGAGSMREHFLELLREEVEKLNQLLK